MCWGMIMYGYKGPLHIWKRETEGERKEAQIMISHLNSLLEAEAHTKEIEWKASTEFTQLKTRELIAARDKRKLSKVFHNYIILFTITNNLQIDGIQKIHCRQSWRDKKFKISKIEHKKGSGVDAWRYVKHVARPILWPECERLILENPNFILMEDGAPSHTATFTNVERLKKGIPKAIWPSLSPDFNPIERIWDWLRREVAKKKVTKSEDLATAMQEAWDNLPIRIINREIEKLPNIMSKCMEVQGNNNYQA